MLLKWPRAMPICSEPLTEHGATNILRKLLASRNDQLRHALDVLFWPAAPTLTWHVLGLRSWKKRPASSVSALVWPGKITMPPTQDRPMSPCGAFGDITFSTGNGGTSDRSHTTADGNLQAARVTPDQGRPGGWTAGPGVTTPGAGVPARFCP